MADKRIVIEIVDNGATAEQLDTPKPEPKKENSVQGTSSNAWQVATYAVSQAESLILQEANYAYDKYLSLTENYVAQNSVAVATNMINGFSSVVSSMASGALFGPAGIAIGAATAVVKLGVNTAKNYISSYETLDEKAYDKYYNGARYGLIDGNRGTQN